MLDELIVFCCQMYVFIKVGIFFICIMCGLVDIIWLLVLVEVLGDVIVWLEGGMIMVMVMQVYLKVFFELFIVMIYVGENIGMLDDVFC